MTIIIFALLGVFIGSFVNALVWRVHEQSAKKKPGKDLSILHGRSMCPHCKHQLGWRDLVPIFSWLSLGGKCRYCKKSISWQYPLVEFSLGVLFTLSYVLLVQGEELSTLEHVQFGGWLAVLSGFMALTVYDFRWMLLPNRIVYPLIGVAAIIAALGIIDGGWDELLATVYSVLIAGGIFFLLFQLSGGKWIGGGDVKLGLLIGLLMQDPAKAFLVLLIASVAGTVVILPGLATKKITPKTRIPFGPFLILGATVVYLVGAQVIDWYKDSLLGL